MFIFQNIIIDTTFTTIPKLTFMRNLVKGHWFKPQPGIHFHNGKTRSNAEYPGLWIYLPGQFEDFFLDRSGYALATVHRGYNEARV